MSIKVIEASINSAMQDPGHKNHAKLNIARSGAMDELSLRTADILLGNRQDEAELELCLRGGKREFLDESYLVLGRVEFEAKLSNKKIQICKIYQVKKSDILELGLAEMGSRGYLCVAGEFKIRSFLNSKLSDVKTGVGIFNGKALQRGDILELNNSFIPFNLSKGECENPVLQFAKEPIIHVVLGTNDDVFTQDGLNTFSSTSCKMGLRNDRMAVYAEVRTTIEHKNLADIILGPAVFGSIQVPKNGLPIILMAGRQSTGGYTEIASVIGNDLPLPARAELETNLKFESISMQNTLELYKQGEEKFRTLGKKINLGFESLV